MSRPRNSDSVFRAIADPKRRRILDLVAQQERTVGDLLGVLPMGNASMSYHLGVLIAAGLIRQHRVGTFRKCAAVPAALGQAEAWIARLRHRKPGRS